jgi:hypothetical protein
MTLKNSNRRFGRFYDSSVCVGAGVDNVAGVKLLVFTKVERSAAETFVGSMDQAMLTILNGTDSATAKFRGEHTMILW